MNTRTAGTELHTAALFFKRGKHGNSPNSRQQGDKLAYLYDQIASKALPVCM